jgi:PPM family protein phosphatase
MSSGDFARSSGLSRKALRLYDELGLLRPAAVDSYTGYRGYAPEQLEQARLVAWLRRLGMPLEQIRAITAMPPSQAAGELSAYWDQVEAEITARRELARFLIGYLSGRDANMPESPPTLTIRYAVQSDIGLRRADNEDAAYAGARLLAVADGMGGHAAGEVASAAVIDALRPLDTQVPAGELLNALDHAVRRASSTLRDLASSDPKLSGMGTTLTALLWSGSQIGLVHIGDTRAYLVRDGAVFQITHDHTLVQSLLDDGKITAEEMASHPQRALLLRALSADRGVEADLTMHEARVGDRYLLCSDGLHATVSAAEITRVLLTVANPDQAVKDLIALAIDGGAPDNVTCIVADVVAPEAVVPEAVASEVVAPELPVLEAGEIRGGHVIVGVAARGGATEPFGCRLDDVHLRARALAGRDDQSGVLGRELEREARREVVLHDRRGLGAHVRGVGRSARDRVEELPRVHTELLRERDRLPGRGGQRDHPAVRHQLQPGRIADSGQPDRLRGDRAEDRLDAHPDLIALRVRQVRACRVDQELPSLRGLPGALNRGVDERELVLARERGERCQGIRPDRARLRPDLAGG